MSYENQWILFPNDLNKILRILEGNYVQTLMAVAQLDTPGMGVKVGSGDAVIEGEYVTKWQSTNVTIATADSTHPRKDIICLKSDGTLVSSGDDVACKGTAEAADPPTETGPKTETPKPPPIPTGYLLLAEVWVPANATQILNANITDRRVLWFQKFPQNLGDVHNQSTYASECGYMRDGYIFHMLGGSRRAFDEYWNKTGASSGTWITRDANTPIPWVPISCWDTQPLRGYGTYEWRYFAENYEVGKDICVGFWWHYRCALGGVYFLIDHVAGDRKCFNGHNGSGTYSVITWDESTEAVLKIEWTPTQIKFYIDGQLKATHTTNIPQSNLHFGSEICHWPKASNYIDHSQVWIKDFKRTA